MRAEGAERMRDGQMDMEVWSEALQGAMVPGDKAGWVLAGSVRDLVWRLNFKEQQRAVSSSLCPTFSLTLTHRLLSFTSHQLVSLPSAFFTLYVLCHHISPSSPPLFFSQLAELDPIYSLLVKSLMPFVSNCFYGFSTGGHVLIKHGQSQSTLYLLIYLPSCFCLPF